MKLIKYLTLALLVSSCNFFSKNQSAGFELLSSNKSGIDFINKVEDREDFNILTYRNYYNGGGVAIGDINNDGLNDIYFTSNMGENKLYLNKGNLKFEDITIKAGVAGKKSWCTGVTFADVNADGYLDIYVCYSGDAKNENKENELFINNKDKTFTEKASFFGLNDSGLSTHASFFDFDLDGDLDCYVLNNSYKDPERISLTTREQFDPNSMGGDRLYQNNNGKFVDITQTSGIFSSDAGFGLGISTGDVNGDLYPDIYISNDFWERDYLYINQKNGTFLESLTSRISYTSLASMGSDIGDLNNDGALDIFSTDMLPPDNYRLKAATKFDEYYQHDLKFRNSYHYQYTQNCLQINQGDGTFVETSQLSDVAATDWSWGALIFDINLDGKKDIFVSNGVFHDITDSDFADFISDKEQVKDLVLKKGKYDFRDFVKFLPPNKRKNYAFINETNSSMPVFKNKADELNLDQESFSNGSAYGDLDNDGDLDLVVNNVNMEAFVYENKATDNPKSSFLKIGFKGSQNNTFGIGATVWVYSSGQMQMAQNFSARGFQSSVSPELVFGFNENQKIDSLRIVWADLKTQTVQTVKMNSSIVLDYTNSSNGYLPRAKTTNVVFSQNNNFLPESAYHIENQYVDFDFDRLLPHGLSTETPKMVVGDINSDGLDDFILLQSHGQTDKVFINNGTGYIEKNMPAFLLHKDRESTAGALFDADGDKDLDFLVAMGGNQYREGGNNFSAEYYENDGKGNFRPKPNPTLNITGMIGVIKPFDFDFDGDIDLFIGGRAVPGGYGLIPRSFMLKNSGNGIWEDITNESTGPIGMVTDAVWSDMNNDNKPDLVVVGEWMPVTVFINQSGFFDKPFAVPNSRGWWNTIEAADIDNDGDIDFMLGNWGQNMKFKATVQKPVNLYVNDFDDNKRSDGILEWYTPDEDKPFPFASKQDLTSQLPGLKKITVKYQEFAKLGVNDLFDKSKFESSLKQTAETFQSSVLINDKGDFKLKPLNVEAQLSPIFSFSVYDFDGDGINDYYAGGNFYRLKPEVGRHDAMQGGFFKGIGNGAFRYYNPIYSGLIAQGEIRDTKILNGKLVIARNNAKAIVYSFENKK